MRWAILPYVVFYCWLLILSTHLHILLFAEITTRPQAATAHCNYIETSHVPPFLLNIRSSADSLPEMPYKEEIRLVTKVILDEMLDDLILTTTISAHREVKRGRVICGTCGTRCRSHLPLLPNNIANSLHTSADASGSSSRAQTPQYISEAGGRSSGYTVGPEKGTGGSTGVGSGSGKVDSSGNAFFDCLVCSRPIASNRYAPHLAKCLGLNGSIRRVAARSAAVKARLGTGHDRSSPSPYLATGSENGDWGSDADSVGSHKKKKTQNNATKRNGSPNKSVAKGKKAKRGSSSGTPTPQFPRQALPPSKLGRPPTNRQTTQSSPVSSPEKSVISVASSGAGVTGSKTLPGAGNTLTEIVLGDESSEDADDDY
ncbi:hypothetical protein C366_03436 [Cryptococcus neoformans Tu401-1]|nr:hypothetical protein C366_03436 [Cryptococcus neoformans var. grubii Tu401-1]